eukprot:TRINITY_DN43787_c0_g1_i1.p1 TRINITY_DN43787_c0_g1~~TRINITY_DN43787_c0_g1_i1.p1  ORF type:complete len:327 (-),score=77.41 TRINITY_DN43787_c0_g1_i1:183-1121(-)
MEGSTSPATPLSVEEPVLIFRDGSIEDALPAQRVLITVAVHGNEQCGLVAINELIKEGFFKDFWRDPGNVSEVVVMIGNPGAAAENKRFLEVNLNRILDEEAKVRSGGEKYEETLTPSLAAAIERSTWYLDIHSTSAPTACFCIPTNKESIRVSEVLPADYVLADILSSLAGTTLHWAQRDLEKVAVCVECGQHAERSSVDHARQAVVHFLAEAAGKRSNDRIPKHILSCKQKQDVRPGFCYPEGWTPSAFQHVEHGQLLAHDEEGDIRCPFPGGAHLVMPTALPIVGEEAWWWGVKQDSISPNEEACHGGV